jgi:uncharacterized Zn finger protein
VARPRYRPSAQPDRVAQARSPESQRHQVGPALAPAKNQAYRQTVALLRKIRGLMVRLGRNQDFRPYLESIRAGHQRKRNFIRMLDRAKW